MSHNVHHVILARLLAWACVPALIGAAGHVAAQSQSPSQPQARQVGAYYASWSAEKGPVLKNFDRAGAADGFTFLIYAFANIYPMPDGTYRCAGGRDVPTDDQGNGMNATLDYARPYPADESVDGSADTAATKVAGNFGQLAKLKARHPTLKVLVALGGGIWSRHFPAAAATPALRRSLVASCIDLYIRGDLPVLDGHGGKGAAAGLFDGIDLDWEHPGPDDKAHFTQLLAEFRRQLDALGKTAGRRYLLTAAVNSTEEKARYTDPRAYSRSLDWINLMTYDFHGGWAGTGPTNFQSNLYSDPAAGEDSPRSVDAGVRRFLAAGVPAAKIVVGVPFYGRGWRGVAPANHGLYQPATGPARGMEEGAEQYATLVKQSAPGFRHPVTRQWWTFDDGTFWSYDDPQTIREKAGYVQAHRLGGLMAWCLDQDDGGFALSKAMATVNPAP